MKKLVSILTLASALFAVSVQAQVQTVNFLVNNGVTSNFPPAVCVIDCSSQKDVAVKWTFNLGGAGTEVMGLRFQPSMDGTLPTVPATSVSTVLANAANGATPVIIQTNIATAGYRFLHVYYVTNGNATFFLTNQLDSFVKRNAP